MAKYTGRIAQVSDYTATFAILRVEIDERWPAEINPLSAGAPVYLSPRLLRARHQPHRRQGASARTRRAMSPIPSIKSEGNALLKRRPEGAQPLDVGRPKPQQALR